MIRRLRIFAGPNGSGKSTVKSVIAPELLGLYLNPDDIEKEVRQHGYYDLRGMDLTISQEEIIDFFYAHPLSQRTNQIDFIYAIRLIDNEFINFSNVDFNSYLSAILTGMSFDRTMNKQLALTRT